MCVCHPLTHNEPLCVRELLEEFPEVLIALLIRWTQHLQWHTESENSSQTSHPDVHSQSVSPVQSPFFVSMSMGDSLVKITDSFDEDVWFCLVVS